MSRFLALLLFLTAAEAAATPSDAQVKKDLGGEGVLSVKLTRKSGTVQGNLDTLNHEFVRGAEILAKTEWPGIKVVIVGDAVYQHVGRGKFRYWKFRVIENRYEGIPNPTDKDIAEVLGRDRSKAFGGGLENILVKVHEWPKLKAEPAWIWHTPMSVSFQTVAKVDQPVSNTEIETRELDVEVRLYRDEIKSPWKTYMATPREHRVLATRKVPAEELRKMPRLRQQHAEEQAQADAAARPKVDLPAFASAEELMVYVHKVLREGPPERAEAVLRATLHPKFFAQGSTVLLSSAGEELVAQSLENAFKKRVTYAQAYCATPNIDAPRSVKGRMYIFGVRENMITQFGAVQTEAGYKDGVKVTGDWKLDEVFVRLRDDDDTLAFIQSFSDRKKICPKD